MSFLLIVTIVAAGNLVKRRLPKDVLTEQGVHPNPGPVTTAAEVVDKAEESSDMIIDKKIKDKPNNQKNKQPIRKLI